MVSYEGSFDLYTSHGFTTGAMEQPADILLDSYLEDSILFPHSPSRRRRMKFKASDVSRFNDKEQYWHHEN